MSTLLIKQNIYPNLSISLRNVTDTLTEKRVSYYLMSM